jgi:hypothetical protein
VAGRELINNQPAGWIRPVSDRQHEEVSEYERQYEDGTDPLVLDIIDVPLKQPQAKDSQPENWLLDPEHYWVKVSTLKPTDLRRFVDKPSQIWANGHHTYNGMNDYVPSDSVKQMGGSLMLIHLSDGLRLHVYTPGEAFGNFKRRVQAEFDFRGVGYRLWVTDPLIEAKYLAQPDGQYDLGPAYTTISLGDEYQGKHYKLVAAVMGGEG